ncbi:MAG TPA: DUF4350 domain-containing protein [Pyrinomonadaceae bacterium]|nr:DUF4350 domain-containing protein [Pyrinomonadaceae bacterium]
MRQRLTIILTFVAIIGLLALVSSLSYIKKDKEEDFEIAPNRSTYHSGPTGTRALHDFLSESGYKVIRWRDTPQRLSSDSGKLVKTFVVVGQIRVRFTVEESAALTKWVAAGGRYVIIDRNPLGDSKESKTGWNITSEELDFPTLQTNPADVKQMTDKVTALRPVQPTVLTQNIQSVLPSRFASRMTVGPPAEGQKTEGDQTDTDEDAQQPQQEQTPPPEQTTSTAPVVHIADDKGALLIDYSYGSGSVVILSDPYIVSNGGIKLDDNLQLALNVITARDGLIAFDEYHQGKGAVQNNLAGYFAGTPVLLIAGQIGLLVLLALWSNGSRFGRPLPLSQVDRRSSLEFVASMAELQQRARAFDLAIENIYTRTRRVLARHAGLDYNSSRSEIASSIAARGTIDAHRLETLMRQCEEVINGAPCSWREAIDLVRRLREVESEMGLRMRSREVRQAAENI